jgi:hypothetical protein
MAKPSKPPGPRRSNPSAPLAQYPQFSRDTSPGAHRTLGGGWDLSMAQELKSEAQKGLSGYMGWAPETCVFVIVSACEHVGLGV